MIWGTWVIPATIKIAGGLRRLQVTGYWLQGQIMILVGPPFTSATSLCINVLQIPRPEFIELLFFTTEGAEEMEVLRRLPCSSGSEIVSTVATITPA